MNGDRPVQMITQHQYPQAAMLYPLDSVEQILIPHADQIQQRHGLTLLKLGAEKKPVLLCQMQQILQYHSPITASLSPQPRQIDMSPVVVLSYQDKLLGLQVKQVIGKQELVIRPLESTIVPPSYIYGSSVLADGKSSTTSTNCSNSCYYSHGQ
ncbi:chemotaxis protein CheW [Chroococcidiopsis sp. TS-821]|uniref:chemotaxis protein CheW n=1 Tax=Chroococcidiopsis sp. TS-821 TaxID=1378066 RepID=UPI000CEEFFF0|nr:chemotaxis protein CheW [Chroococcidiopsis sp. TS-821]PPS45105.1 hypothetical protein B1A85_02200 [Chroococcidiopsis sp. TS-821]